MNPVMTEESNPTEHKRLAETEVRHEFVSTVAAEDGEQRGHLIGALTEKKIFHRSEDHDDDMPLPTNPQTIFLGGLFTLAVMAAMYVTAEVLLPVILAIILKLLLQPLV